MTSTNPGTASGRRSFIRLASAVLAGGAGAITLGGAASAAPTRTLGTNAARQQQPGTRPNNSRACAIFCTKQCCNCCASGGNNLVNLYHCVATCGYDYYQCSNSGCASFCASLHAC